MNRTAIRLAIALASFLVGASVVYLIWFAGKQSAPAAVAVSSSALELVNSHTSSSDGNLEERPVEEEWAGLLEEGGCLFGSVYYNPRSEVPAEAPGVFTNQRWQAFFRRSKQETVPFLIKRIPDKSKTNLHVDPFRPPTEGEAAVYALQHILKVNWYELKEAYRVRYDRAGYPFTHQALLQQIIKTMGGAKEMQDLWMRYYENHAS